MTTNNCTQPECDRPIGVHKDQLCFMHYQRLKRTGKLFLPTTAEERFNANHIKKTCWEWTGSFFDNGYGRIGVDYKTMKAHRYSWELHNNKKIPEDFIICHTCDNKFCVNPAHLVCRDTQWNALDREVKGRGNTPKGENHCHAKLTEDDVRYIRESTETAVALAKKLRISISNISVIRRRTTWKHI